MVLACSMRGHPDTLTDDGPGLSPVTATLPAPHTRVSYTVTVLFCTIYVSFMVMATAAYSIITAHTQFHTFDANASRLRYRRAKPEHITRQLCSPAFGVFFALSANRGLPISGVRPTYSKRLELRFVYQSINYSSQRLISICSYESERIAASQPQPQAFAGSIPSRQSGMVQPVVQEMLAAVLAACSSFFGLFSSDITYNLRFDR
eukprot:scaffold4599_cov116-Isochrysis_galbana.AAC.3